KLSGVLSGKRLALADLAPAFGADPQEQKKPTKGAGRVLPQEAFDLPSLANMEADLKVDLESADLGTDMLRDLAPLTGRIVLREQVLAVEELVARTADGELRGRVSLDARKETPVW